MDFEKFPSLTRFSQGWTITEKLDGTNAQVVLVPASQWDENPDGSYILPKNTLREVDAGPLGYFAILAGSRNRYLSLEKDNMGFARFVYDNAQELAKLGIGRHFGEWYGSGIQRTYGLTGGDKRFALFNSLRWKDNPGRPECCETVYTFLHDDYADNPDGVARGVMAMMKENGSYHVPGFMNPEGIVMFHRKSGVTFKKTFDYDEQGKWAELQEAKQG